jgi:hypothetical protein
VGVAFAGMMVAGCATGICDRPEKEDPTVFNGGEIVGNTYRTSDFDGDLLHFPGGAFYQIRHGLGVRPTHIQFWLSFSRDGIKNGGSDAPAAGNQAELKSVDDEQLTVLNASCSDYFLIVQAWTDGPGAGGAGDGGAGAGGAGGAGGN